MKKTELLAYAFFGAIGIAVVGVIGSIAYNAFKNQGFLPPPGTLSRYACTLGDTPFEFFYMHGTDRVKVKSLWVNSPPLGAVLFSSLFETVSEGHCKTETTREAWES